MVGSIAGPVSQTSQLTEISGVILHRGARVDVYKKMCNLLSAPPYRIFGALLDGGLTHYVQRYKKGEKTDLMGMYAAGVNFIKNKNKILQVILVTGSFLVLLLFMWLRMDCLLDSDISTQLVLSKFLHDERTILSENWYYATELHVLGYNLVYELLFFVSNNWKIVRFAGQAILYIILLVSIFYFCKKINIEKYYGIIATAFIIPYSEQYFAFVLKNINYIPFLAISFLSIGMVFDFYQSANKLKKAILIVCAALLAFGAGLGGSRQLYITYAPMFLAATGYFFLDRKSFKLTSMPELIKEKKIRFGLIVLIGIVFNLLGYVVNNTILASKYDFVSYDKIVWNGFQISKFSGIIAGVFQNLGMSSGKVFSLGAVHSGTCFLLVGISTYVIWQVTKNYKNVEFETTMLSFFIISSVIISVVLYSFTSQGYAARYDLFWAVFVYPMIMLYIKEDTIGSRYITALLPILILGVGISSIDSYKKSYEVDKTSELRKIAETLQNDGYENGYGTFWNASILTELSNGNIEMWDWNDGDVYNVDSVYRWAQDKAHEYKHPTGKVFWICTENEADNYGVPSKADQDFIIYQSDENINKDIYDSSKRKTKYVVYGFNSYEEMYSLVGTAYSGERTIESQRSGETEGITLYPDTYQMIIQGENLKECDIELTCKQSVKYQHSYVVEDGRTNIEIERIEKGDTYAVLTFTIRETVSDIIAKTTNCSSSTAKITSVETKKTFGDYSDFYRNKYVTNGYDDHGIRTLEQGGISYGPYKTLVPGTYRVECQGESLNLVGFDCTYDAGESEIEIYNIEQDADHVYYTFRLKETTTGIEFRIFNDSEQTVRLTSLKVIYEGK